MDNNIIKLVTDLEELDENIKKELEILSILKKRKLKTEKHIIDFLNVYNQPGFMYKNKLYTPKEVKIYKQKKKTEKHDEIISVLKQTGIQPDSTSGVSYQVTRDQIITGINMAAAELKSKGIDINNHPFFSKINTDADYREKYINRVQTELQKQINTRFH